MPKPGEVVTPQRGPFNTFLDWQNADRGEVLAHFLNLKLPTQEQAPFERKIWKGFYQLTGDGGDEQITIPADPATGAQVDDWKESFRVNRVIVFAEDTATRDWRVYKQAIINGDDSESVLMGRMSVLGAANRRWAEIIGPSRSPGYQTGGVAYQAPGAPFEVHRGMQGQEDEFFYIYTDAITAAKTVDIYVEMEKIPQPAAILGIEAFSFIVP